MCIYNYSRLNWPLADSKGHGWWARSVIPVSFFLFLIAVSQNSPEILGGFVAWFAIVPLLKISLCSAAIKPIKFLIIFLPIQSNPSIVGATSIPQQVVNKFVFILGFDHCKVCSQILTKSPWIVPCWGRRCTSNVIALKSLLGDKTVAYIRIQQKRWFLSITCKLFFFLLFFGFFLFVFVCFLLFFSCFF